MDRWAKVDSQKRKKGEESGASWLSVGTTRAGGQECIGRKEKGNLEYTQGVFQKEVLVAREG